MTRILHLTHGRNLTSILRERGLWANNHRPEKARPAVDISHANIQARRAGRRVSCGPGGVLHDYVPFYFGARSPMLYVNHRGNVAGNPDGQRPLVYLVAFAEEVVRAGRACVFTDGHAEMALARFFDDLGALCELDWEAVHARDWRDTPQQPDRSFRKQAEFLVHRFFPVDLIREIVVLDKGVSARAGQILTEAGVEIPVTVNSSWYY